MLVMLQRALKRQTARQRFLREVSRSEYPVFHQWLTPHEFGRQFGARDEDVQTVATYALQIHRTVLTTSLIGSESDDRVLWNRGQVREALHTEIHQYAASGRSFYANDKEISLLKKFFP